MLILPPCARRFLSATLCETICPIQRRGLPLASIQVPDLASPDFKANPYPFYARLRAEAPVFPTKVLGRQAWLVTRYDDVLQVLKDDRFANDWSPKMPWLLLRFARPMTRGMLNQDPPDHTRLRTLVSKAFTPRLVEHLREQIQSITEKLLNPAASNGRMELVRDFALPLPLRIISDLLGIPEADSLRFHRLSRTMLAVSSTFGLVRALPDSWLFMRHLHKIFAERRARPSDDLVTALVQAEEAGDRLNEDELVAMTMLLLVAGYETTVNLIASGTLALIQHPAQRHRFLQSPALAESAVEELLRFTSPLEIASFRLVREEVTLASVTLPPGELVSAVIGSANHDESQFPDPDDLDIARAPNRHLAFGMGAHFCLGAPLARLEGQIALTTLFRRFPKLRLAEPPDSLRWRPSLLLRALEELPLNL